MCHQSLTLPGAISGRTSSRPWLRWSAWTFMAFFGSRAENNDFENWPVNELSYEDSDERGFPGNFPWPCDLKYNMDGRWRMTKQKLMDPDSYPGPSFDGCSGLDGLPGFFSTSADLSMNRNPINEPPSIASHLLRRSALGMMRTMFLRSFASIFKQWDDYCFLSTRKSWETYLLGWQWQLNRSLQGWNRFSWASCLSIIFTRVFQSIYIYLLLNGYSSTETITVIWYPSS